MASLDDLPAMEALDRSGVYGSVLRLGDQVEQAWEEIAGIHFPDSYRGAENIVVCGMGGSMIGAHLVQAVFRDALPMPLVMVGGYRLPKFVDAHSLVVLSSYSGNTEEVLSCAHDAFERRAMVTGITIGGRLAEILRSEKVPAYIFDPRHNPAGQPRLAMGYSVAAQVALLARLGYLTVSKSDVAAVVRLLGTGEDLYGRELPLEENPAKQLAEQMHKRVPILVAAEHLEGAAHVFANQLNESSKSFSDFRVIPELNHHLMEGLANPRFLKSGMVFVFFTSKHYLKEIRLRFSLTHEVVQKNGLAAVEIEIVGKGELLEAFALVLLGSYVNYYLAMKYDVDPAPIPWVEYFKKRLSERSA